MSLQKIDPESPEFITELEKTIKFIDGRWFEEYVYEILIKKLIDKIEKEYIGMNWEIRKPEENWNVVESFLKLNNNFSLESGEYFIPKNWLNDHSCLETFPPNDLVDGMFAARFRKI